MHKRTPGVFRARQPCMRKGDDVCTQRVQFMGKKITIDMTHIMTGRSGWNLDTCRLHASHSPSSSLLLIIILISPLHEIAFASTAHICGTMNAIGVGPKFVERNTRKLTSRKSLAAVSRSKQYLKKAERFEHPPPSSSSSLLLDDCRARSRRCTR